MSVSLKNRMKSAANMTSVGGDDIKALGEVLHRSTKTFKLSKKTKASDQFLHPGHIYHPDSDSESTRRSPTKEHMTAYMDTCPCDSHYEKQFVERRYDLTADKLFDLIFGTNEFVRTYRQAQRIFDDIATEWIVNSDTNQRERTLNYKVPLESTLIGKGIITTNEKQTILYEQPGSYYIIETEVSNSGVKFADSFILLMRYCIVQVSSKKTGLRVTGLVRFCKQPLGFIKIRIEKNAYSASQESLKDLNNRLNLITNFKMEKHRISKEEISLVVPSLKHERGRRKSRHDALGVSTSDSLIDRSDKNHSSSSGFSQPNGMTYLFMTIIVFLFLIHIYLFMKLKHMDHLVDGLARLIKVSATMSGKRRG